MSKDATVLLNTEELIEELGSSEKEAQNRPSIPASSRGRTQRNDF